jgi:Kef-type K+ transport system membrane component KefB
MHDVAILKDIGLSIIFATLAAHLARLFRQPLILGYILGGILLGSPMGLNLVYAESSIEVISEIGLIFLLFIIGLEIKIPDLLRMGSSMLMMGVIQFFGCAALAAGAAHLFLDVQAGGQFDLLYLAVCLSLSSTLIVVKLLQDKFETHSTAGRLTIGILILQDIWAIAFLAFQPNLQNPDLLKIATSFGLGVLLVVSAFAFSRFLLSRIFLKMSRNPELILLTAIAWCFLIAGAAQEAGLSKEMGALIAGLSIGAFPYGSDIIAKITGVRDFFVTLFFVSLGLKMPPPSPALFQFSFIVIGVVVSSRLLTIMLPAWAFGKGLRIGAVTAINLAQISEFSLVIAALGESYGHISQGLASQILSATLLSSIFATYLIQYNDRLASWVVYPFHLLGLRKAGAHAKEQIAVENSQDILILGCFRWAMDLLDRIEEHEPDLKKRILVVDFNAALKKDLDRRGIAYLYADLAHSETLHHLHLEKISVIISPLSDTFLKGTTAAGLLRQIRQLAPHARIIMTADDEPQRKTLLENGASHVMSLSEAGGEHLFQLLMEEKNEAG